MSLLPNTFDGLVRLGIQEALFEARTIVPAKVTKWIPEKQAIQCQPLIRRKRIIDEEIVVDDYPELSQVPVSFPRWGGFVIRMPLQEGDIVTLVIADREIERWLAGDGASPVTPRGYRTNSLDDAIAYPGLAPWGSPIADLDDGELVIGREDGAGELRIGADGTLTVSSNTEVRLAAGGEADQHIPRGEDLLQFLSDFVSIFNSHQHQAPAGTAGGPTVVLPTQVPGFPQPPPSNTLLSQKAKVK